MDPPRPQPTPCPTGTLLAFTDDAISLLHARCKRWACHECRPRKSRQLAARIMRTTARRFITLPIRAIPGNTPQENLDVINAAWRTLWKRIKRAQGTNAVGYIKVVEVTAQGVPHLHIAADCGWISQRDLSNAWDALTGSRVVDIRVVRTKSGVARYLAKYLTKASEHLEGRRKFGASRGFLPPHEPTPLEPGELSWQYKYLRADLDAVRSNLIADGFVAFGDALVSRRAARVLNLSDLTAPAVS